MKKDLSFLCTHICTNSQLLQQSPSPLPDLQVRMNRDDVSVKNVEGAISGAICSQSLVNPRINLEMFSERDHFVTLKGVQINDVVKTADMDTTLQQWLGTEGLAEHVRFLYDLGEHYLWALQCVCQFPIFHHIYFRDRKPLDKTLAWSPPDDWHAPEELIPRSVGEYRRVDTFTYVGVGYAITPHSTYPPNKAKCIWRWTPPFRDPLPSEENRLWNYEAQKAEAYNCETIDDSHSAHFQVEACPITLLKFLGQTVMTIDLQDKVGFADIWGSDDERGLLFGFDRLRASVFVPDRFVAYQFVPWQGKKDQISQVNGLDMTPFQIKAVALPTSQRGVKSTAPPNRIPENHLQNLKQAISQVRSPFFRTFVVSSESRIYVHDTELESAPCAEVLQPCRPGLWKSYVGFEKRIADTSCLAVFHVADGDGRHLSQAMVGEIESDPASQSEIHNDLHALHRSVRWEDTGRCLGGEIGISLRSSYVYSADFFRFVQMDNSQLAMGDEWKSKVDAWFEPEDMISAIDRSEQSSVGAVIGGVVGACASMGWSLRIAKNDQGQIVGVMLGDMDVTLRESGKEVYEPKYSPADAKPDDSGTKDRATSLSGSLGRSAKKRKPLRTNGYGLFLQDLWKVPNAAETVFGGEKDIAKQWAIVNLEWDALPESERQRYKDLARGVEP